MVTTHDMVLAERACDRVGFIVDGRLVEVGDPGRMRRRHGAPEVLPPNKFVSNVGTPPITEYPVSYSQGQYPE